MRYFKIDMDDLVVLNDDIDVPYGKVKLKRNGGHGGHNGLRDIIAKTGSSEFIRVKLGVGRPADDRHAVSDWVLGKFDQDELEVIEQQMPEEVSVRLKIFGKHVCFTPLSEVFWLLNPKGSIL